MYSIGNDKKTTMLQSYIIIEANSISSFKWNLQWCHCYLDDSSEYNLKSTHLTEMFNLHDEVSFIPLECLIKIKSYIKCLHAINT